MTTKEAEERYRAQHFQKHGDKPFAVFNPHDKPTNELPRIYGFNNGGSPGFLTGQLIAEDGEAMGSHCCSHEVYIPHDLGCLEGSRPDRHEGFRNKYPDGYVMEFVCARDVKGHAELMEAYRLNQEGRPNE